MLLSYFQETYDSGLPKGLQASSEGWDSWGVAGLQTARSSGDLDTSLLNTPTAGQSH